MNSESDAGKYNPLKAHPDCPYGQCGLTGLCVRHDEGYNADGAIADPTTANRAFAQCPHLPTEAQSQAGERPVSRELFEQLGGNLKDYEGNEG